MKIAFILLHPKTTYFPTHEDISLLTFLKEKGLDIHDERWHDESVLWEQYDAVILKSPWDYHKNLPGFLEWITRVESLGIKILNPADTVRWNSDKRYLLEISKSGLATIPFIHLERNDVDVNPATWFSHLETDRLILKPTVSAGAYRTHILTKDTIERDADGIHEQLKSGGNLVQPFIPEIANGEWSFLFFNGQYSHAVLKLPKKGDFRVQAEHGGSTVAKKPKPQYISEATAYVEAFAKDTLYARVDGVIRQGRFELMELELIEPYLFLATCREAMESYHRGLRSLLGGA